MQKIKSRSGRIILLNSSRTLSDYGYRYQKELLESYDRQKGDNIFFIVAKMLLITTLVIVMLSLAKSLL